MSAGGDKHERTFAFAETALRQIKALRQPAEPRDYEIWYNYATGYNPALNKAINTTLAHKGNLSSRDVEDLHQTFFSPARISERLDTVGAKLVGEIDEVLSLIDAAAGSTSSYTDTLGEAAHQLGRVKDRDALRALIESLVQTTRAVEQSNQELEARLRNSRQEMHELQETLEAVRHESLSDPLTSLANRKCFDQALAKAVEATNEKSRPLSLLMIDIDRFKSFNDTYGHLTGDQVLRLVALCVKQNVKGQDLAARYGGEEFAVILPDTGLRDALTVADHIRRAVMGKELMKRSTGESLGRVTISVGVASLHSGDTGQSLIERADACLYAAKRHGRNRAICETDPEAAPPQPRVA